MVNTEHIFNIHVRGMHLPSSGHIRRLRIQLHVLAMNVIV